MTNRSVIIDTDPGLDDAIAVLFAFGIERFNVLGLATVAGNIGIERTTANAASLATLMGRGDVAIARGANAPLVRNAIDEVAIHGNDGLGGVTLAPGQNPVTAPAHLWMAEQLRAAPAGSIDTLALGPLTNLALLIQHDPEAARRIGRVIAMGGAIVEKGNVGPRSEFNFAVDPEAAEMVFGFGFDLTLIPLDVTRKVRADEGYVASFNGTLHGDVAAKLLEAYFLDGRQSRPLHDPCVMLYALEPEIFGIEELTIALDLTDDPGALVVSNAGVPLKVAMTVDVQKTLDLLHSGFVS
ncbi:nucleoside hydrolase [Devosia sp. MC1541]|uniref:nucleoside hydrolase n=1 Tax=Devosia sp. MC1541 TaxID=2725264 RepID=UPI00145DA6C0|nr:nucleoside hydrolase [Devosia sp. MC1541]